MMLIMTESLHRTFVVFLSCLATFCLCQQQKNVSEGSSSTEVQTRVGWVAGPTQRGTLRLVYGCLSTIFACTWTVLHLNVPGQDEPQWRTSVRKLKWMAITILFPEFMFAKAICELRLAVADLAAMHKALRKNPIEWTDTQSVDYNRNGSIIETTVSWEVDFNSRMRALHRFFRLPDLPAIDKISDQAVSSPIVDRFASHASTHSNYSVPEVETRTSSDLEHGGSASALSRHASGISAVHSANPADATIELQQIDSSRAAARISMDGADDSALDLSMSSRSERGPPRKYKFSEKRFWTLSHSIYANMGGLTYITQSITMDSICSLLASTLAHSIEADYTAGQDWRVLDLSEDDIQDKSKADWLLKTIVCFQITWLVLTALSRAITNLPVTQLEIATVAFAVLAVATFMANWWKPKDVATPTLLPAGRIFFPGNDEVLVQSFSRRVLKPSKGDVAPFTFDRSRITNDTIWMDGQPPIALVLLSVSSMVFGGLHVLAWNSDFPSDVERMLWRVSIVAIATLPAICLSITFLIEHLALVYIPKRELAKTLELLAPLKHVSQTYRRLLGDSSALETWLDHTQSVQSTKLSSLKDLHRHLNEALDACAEGDQQVLNNLYWVFQASRDETITASWSQFETHLKSQIPESDSDSQNFKIYEFLISMKGLITSLESSSRRHISYCDAASRCIAISNVVLYAIARLSVLVIMFTALRSVDNDTYNEIIWTNFVPSFS